MALSTEVVARKYLDVTADTPISVDIPVFKARDVFVYYGSASLLARQGVDYTLELASDFNTLVVTPTSQMLDKINALMSADTTEINYITVRRTLNYETEATSDGVRYTPFTSREFDRNAMRDQQLRDVTERALTFPPGHLAEEVDGSVVNVKPGQLIRRNDDGSGFSGTDTEVVVTEVHAWFQNRDVTSATQAALMTEGSIVSLNGIKYEVDSSAVGALSATNDLGVNGLKAFSRGHVSPFQFGGSLGGNATANRIALQAAINTGQDVILEGVGTYATDGPVFMRHTGSYYRMDTGQKFICSPTVTLTRNDTAPSNFINRTQTGQSVAAGAGVTVREGAFFKNNTASAIVLSGVHAADAVSDGLVEVVSEAYEEAFLVLFGSNNLIDGLNFENCKRTIMTGQDPDQIGTENSHTSFNRYRNIWAKNCSVGFTSRASLGDYYSSLKDIHVFQCQVGFDIGQHSASIGVAHNNNRNFYENCRAARCHVGYHITMGDTNTFTACHTEGCAASPTNNPYSPPDGLPDGEDTWSVINLGAKNTFIACVDEGGEKVLFSSDAEAQYIASWWREGSTLADYAKFTAEPRLMLNASTAWLNGGKLSILQNTKADVFGGRQAGALLDGNWRRSGDVERFDQNADQTGQNDWMVDLGAVASSASAAFDLWPEANSGSTKGNSAAAFFDVDVLGDSDTNNLGHHTKFRVIAKRNSSKTVIRYFVTDIVGGRATGGNAGDATEAFTPVLSLSGRDLVLTLTAPARTFERVTVFIRSGYNRP